MKILVACEESQRVCIELRKLGHEAYSCDIIDCSGGHPEWHIKQDVLPLLNGNCRFKTVDETSHSINSKWDMLIAHPPCTYLSNAGACRLYPKKGQLNQKRYQKGLRAKEFFMKFYNADCEHICIENPIPSKIYDLPPYTQTIQPFEHGHPYSKKTCLWLKGLPKLQPTNILTEYKPYIPCNTSKNKGNKEKAGVSRAGGVAKIRSKTFEGIAKAMSAQWAGQATKEKAASDGNR